MLSWLTSTTVGKFIATFLISMVPVVELRGGLPYGIGFGLPYWAALTAAVLGNMLPVPFIIVFIKRIFKWMRTKSLRMNDLVNRLEKKAENKRGTIEKYGLFGLIILVAIPLPGTGAWTGSLVAAIMNMQVKHSVPCIFIGVLIAAGIMTAVTFGVIHVAG